MANKLKIKWKYLPRDKIESAFLYLPTSLEDFLLVILPTKSKQSHKDLIKKNSFVPPNTSVIFFPAIPLTKSKKRNITEQQRFVPPHNNGRFSPSITTNRV